MARTNMTECKNCGALLYDEIVQDDPRIETIPCEFDGTYHDSERCSARAKVQLRDQKYLRDRTATPAEAKPAEAKPEKVAKP